MTRARGVVAAAVILFATAGAAAQPATGADALLAEAKSVMVTDSQRAYALAVAAETQAAALGGSKRDGVAAAKWLQGEALMRLHRSADARPVVDAAMALLAKQPESKLFANLLMTRGSLASDRGAAELAVRDFQRAYILFGRFDDLRSQAKALQYLGSIYQDAGDFERVLYYNRLAEESFSKDAGLNLSSANNRANALSELGRFAEAEIEYQRALKLAEPLHSRSLSAQILDNIATTEIDKHDYSAAQKALAAALQLSATGAAAAWRPKIMATAARLALRREQPSEAVRLLEAAFALPGVNTATQTFRDAHETAYQAYTRLGDYRQALHHFEAAKKLEDEGRALRASTNASLLTARFDFANQNARIANLKAGQLQRDFTLARFKARQNALILGGLLAAVSVIAGLMAIYLRSLRRNRDAIRAVNAQLNVANTDLSAALATKSEFLATTSHEIRTPLNGVLGMTQVILADRTVTGVVRERVALVQSAGEAMRTLVDDILDFAKMDAGKLDIHPTEVELPALLRDIVAFWQARASEQGLTLTLELADCPGRIVADARRLRQILSNLLSNAIKFTLDGGVTVRVATEAGERLRIAVSDTGIGIPDDAYERIFEKFRQLDSSTTRRFGGTGLGLAISDGLARALGGAIELRSEVGVGSTFTLTLPLQLAAPKPADATRGTGLAAARLVVIGANPIAQAMLRAALTPVVAAFDVAENVEQALLGQPDILLVDATRDAEDWPAGLAALTAMMARTAAAKVQLVLLWPNAEVDELAVLRAHGDACLISKPVRTGELIQRLEASLARGDVAELVTA